MTFEIPPIDLQTHLLSLDRSVLTVFRFYVSVIITFVVQYSDSERSVLSLCTRKVVSFCGISYTDSHSKSTGTRT